MSPEAWLLGTVVVVCLFVAGWLSKHEPPR